MGERTLSVGDHVWFYDSKGRRRDALVLIVWGEHHPEHNYHPCINLVVVCEDEERQDTYGRQTFKETSVPYGHEHCAHGFYWHFVGDAPIPYKQPAQS